MSVRFIVGRSGTGKSHHCVAAIRERLRRDAVDGPRLILLVPEQAGLQMERALLDTPRGGDKAPDAILASHRAEVLSFRRLAFRVLDSVGKPVGVALTEAARSMVLRHLAIEHAGELRYYGRLARAGRSSGRLSGFIERLGATINELMEEAVEPEELAALVGGSDVGVQAEAHGGSSSTGDPAQQAKLHDAALLYRAYREYLGTTRMDPSQYLQTARGLLRQCPWLRGAELWVDGFASFSGQERLTLIELARLCSAVEITALVDPLLVGTYPQDANREVDDPEPGSIQIDRPRSRRTLAGKPPVAHVTRHMGSRQSSGARSAADRHAAERLFSRIARTYSDLSRGFEAAGIAVEPPLVLAPDVPPRFDRAPTLACIERTLFATPGETQRATPRPAGEVRLVELPDRRTEVDYAVSCIIDWVQQCGISYRYRDVAIIVRDLDRYHDLLAGALESRGIPFFIDRRRPVVHHPLVELVRIAPALAAESLSLESVRILLKSDLLALPRDAADELENYLIAHGIGGAKQWREGPWRFRSRSSFAADAEEVNADGEGLLERVNATRARVFESIEPWLRLATEHAAPTGAEWARAVVALLERLNAGTTLRSWFETAQANGDLDQAEEHEQVWNDVLALIDDLSFALGETPLTVKALGDVLDTGLSGLTLGLVPPTIDQVLVGSIERSRHPDIKAAVIVGFNEGVFPQRPTEDAIFNDDDRASLQQAGVRIGPPASERIGDESMLFYIAMTRAAESVVVTYATADEDGRALRPSPYLGALRAACPGLTSVQLGDSRRQRATWDVLSAADLRERVVQELRERPPGDRDDLAVRARWNELYAWARQALADDESWLRALSSLVEENEASLSAASVERLYRGTLRTSVSRLETYAACPFQYFTRYTLDLRERETAALEPVDMGQVHHAILDDFVRSVIERGDQLDRLGADAAIDALRDSCARVAARLPDDARVSNARNAYLLRRSAAQLARVLAAQRRAGAAGRARPRRTELPFGMKEPGSLPALELSTPNGRRVLLRGYIDRVDVAELSDELLGVVIDYKRTRDKRLDLTRVYSGISLQLIAYLLVLAEHGKSLTGRPIRPVGGVFVGLQSNYRLVDGPDDEKAITRAAREAHRPRGLIRFEDVEWLDAAMSDAGVSEYYSIGRTKQGSLRDVDRSDGACGRDFDALLEHTRVQLGELADGVLNGDVTVRPYRLGTFSPCSWCAMASVCRFEWGISMPRFIEPMKRSEVFARLTRPDREST